MGSALLPIGAAAIVAGCSGGGVTSGGAYVPASSRAMTKAQITLQFAVSGNASSSSRRAQALPSTTQQVGIRFIPNPAPAVTPTEQLFTVPQPVPASTTLIADAPVGADTLYVGAYQPAPSCHSVSGLFPLMGAVQSVNIASNGTNALPISVQPLAFSAQVQITGSSIPGQWSPFENWTTTQTGKFTVTPVDFCGNPLSSGAPNGIVLSAPSGAAFAPLIGVSGVASATTSGTYTAGANARGSIASVGGLPVTTPGATPTPLPLVPDYYLFVAGFSGQSLQVYDALTQQPVGSSQSLVQLSSSARRPLNRSTQSSGTRRASAYRRPQALSTASGGYLAAMAATGAATCPGAGFNAAAVLVGNFGTVNGINNVGVEVVTVTGGSVGMTPVAWPDATFAPIAVTIDQNCVAYVGDAAGYLGVMTNLGSPVFTLNPNYQGAATGNHNFQSLLATSSGVYVADNGPVQIGTYPLGSTNGTIGYIGTGNLASPDRFVDAGLAPASGNLFVSYLDSSGNCIFNGFSSGSPLTNVMVSPYQQMVSAGSQIFVADEAGTFYVVAEPTNSVLSSSSGCFSGVAVSKDAQSSTVWVSSAAAGAIAAFSLPYPSPPAASPVPVATLVPAAISSPGGLAIAP
jgi:hypothetical protein